MRELINVLQLQRDLLAGAIENLERYERTAKENGLAGVTGVAKRRGRKSMGAEERKEVSARMKRYWAERRHQSARKQG